MRLQYIADDSKSAIQLHLNYVMHAVKQSTFLHFSSVNSLLVAIQTRIGIKIDIA